MIQPINGTLHDKKKGNDDNLPVDNIKDYDFNRLDYLMANSSFADTGTDKDNKSDSGVRFSDTENPKPGFRLMPGETNKMSDMLIKGVAHISGAIVKNLVTGTLQTIFPFLIKKNDSLK